MALRRSSHSAWGLSSERELGPKTLVVVGAVCLLLGSLLGWAVKGGGGDGSDSGDEASQSALVIAPVIDGVSEAPQTEAGAVKAATALITGFPNLSVQTSATQGVQLGKLVAPDANVDVMPILQSSLQQFRDTFMGSAGAERRPVARITVTPVTFKTEMISPNRARVQVWYTTVLIDPARSHVESTWNTADVQLGWTDHWRVVAFNTLLGPTPQPYAPNAIVSEYGDVVKVFDGFKAYSSAVQ